MELVLPRSWKEEFERAATASREDAVYKEQLVRFNLAERERRERELEVVKKTEESDERAVMDAVLATAQEITKFTIELDRYDTKTVEALMDNQEALAAVREKIDVLMDHAEVLPDGRRVFKTKDGQHVFDEHGQEMSRETIDPNSIDDRKPKWEAFRAEREAEKRLTEERQQLIDYQAKLDHARERLNKGEITEGELKELKASLKAEMPEAVRDKLEHEKADPAAERPKDAPAPMLPNDMDALMQKTGFAPGPATR